MKVVGITIVVVMLDILFCIIYVEFVIFVIHGTYCETFVYIPGKYLCAHSIPVETIPVKNPSQTNGPPESPYNHNMKYI